MSRIHALSAAAILAAFVLITLVTAGCGGGGFCPIPNPTPTPAPKILVSEVPSENWATTDQYQVVVWARESGGYSHPLSRGEDGCVHTRPGWKLDFHVVYASGDVEIISGGVDVWNIAFQLPQLSPTADWALPAGAYRVTSKMPNEGPRPFETVIVENSAH
jgi:hypothetical protein